MANNEWILPKRFTIQIIMDSDWHVGAGYGQPGSIDRLVARDNDGLPFIPAKTITGILRDACEQLCYGLDNGVKNGPWSQWIERLFGNQPALPDARYDQAPRPALISIGPLRLPQSLAAHLKKGANGEANPLQAGLTFIKPGIEIDWQTGGAKDDYLRFEELARRNLMLETECRLSINDDEMQLKTISALLRAGARLVENLGGKRRRGLGRCHLIFNNQNNLGAGELDWLEEHPLPPDPPAITKKEPVKTVHHHKPGDGDQWYSLPLLLILKTPLAVPDRTIGNTTTTLDFLPGSYLLPDISRILDKLNIDYRAAIISGLVKALPAMMEVADRRGRPVPAALFYYKQGGGFNNPGSVKNRFKERPASENSDDQQLKGYRQGYIGEYGAKQFPHYRGSVPLMVNTHNTVEDSVQRPTENVGGVYSREAIQADTRLRTELRIHKSIIDSLNKHPEWWREFNGLWRLGASRKDDYGQVEVIADVPTPFVSKAEDKKDGQLFVWLLSDLLMRDRQLRPTTDINRLAELLTEQLGVKLVEAKSSDYLSAMVRTRRIESWQTKWVLPRPTLLAIAGGSCVVFNVTGDISVEKLKALETTGIGERCSEGYGQLCFNEPLIRENLQNWQSPAIDKNSANQDDDKDRLIKPSLLTAAHPLYTIADRIERSVWRVTFQRQIIGLAASMENRREMLGIELNNPDMSQLGSLRAVVQRLKDRNNPDIEERERERQRDREIFLNWLERLKRSSNRKDRWPSKALERITDLITKPNEVWRMIEWQSPPAMTVDATERLQNEMWAEVVRTLVDACIRARKRATE